VGPPDDIEALAGPLPRQPGEVVQLIRRRCGRGSWFCGCGQRRRFFLSRRFFLNWWLWPENKICDRFYDAPLIELESKQ